MSGDLFDGLAGGWGVGCSWPECCYPSHSDGPTTKDYPAPVSVQDEKACLKGPAVVACGVCTGSLGGRAVLHVIQLDI